MIPRSTCPLATKRGISAAGRKTRAISWFSTNAISLRFSLRNRISEPARRSRVGCCSRPSRKRGICVSYSFWEESKGLGSLFGIAKTRRPSRLVKQLEECSIKSIFSPLGYKVEESLPIDQTHGCEETTLQDVSPSTQGDTVD